MTLQRRERSIYHGVGTCVLGVVCQTGSLNDEIIPTCNSRCFFFFVFAISSFRVFLLLTRSPRFVVSDEEGRYHLSPIYSSHDAAEVKFPLTNGSLFAHLMNPPSTDAGRGNSILTYRTAAASNRIAAPPVGPSAADPIARRSAVRIRLMRP